METGSKKGRIIYVGDDPEFFTNGVTISFDLNLCVLSDDYEVVRIKEHLHPDKGILEKLRRANRCVRTLRLFLNTGGGEKTALYVNMPLSILGLLRVYIYMLIASKRGAKTILHLHRGDFFTAFYKGGLRKFLIGLVLKKPDYLIVLSESTKNSFAREFPYLNIIALPNRIEKECDLKGVKSKKNSFLFLSNYFQTKGIFDLLEVFAEISRAHQEITLTCYGAFPNEKMKQKIKSYASDRIKIYGEVTGMKKFEVIRSASCMILPSWSEGQPLVLLEAMSQATPVIATDVGTVSDMLGSDYPFLIRPGDREGLKKKIIKVIETNILDPLGEQLYKRYQKYYSIAHHNEALESTFDAIFNE